MGGLSGQESGRLNRPSRDIESMERRLQRLLELYPELAGTSLSEYVEALSKKSTSEVK
jgi:predicted translin family RNA/ssDNA-binding protein|tara:strand:- start:6152 stop:6325 length:174 start_codon:yes stop_codon:yes gene_type:complete